MQTQQRAASPEEIIANVKLWRRKNGLPTVGESKKDFNRNFNRVSIPVTETKVSGQRKSTPH